MFSTPLSNNDDGTVTGLFSFTDKLSKLFLQLVEIIAASRQNITILIILFITINIFILEYNI